MENKNYIVVGVDTGNRCIKTATHISVAGLYVSDQPHTFKERNTICYNGKYYMPSTDRCSYRKNKAEDDNYFVLTLFGVLNELRARGIEIGPGATIPQIVLAVGLPPAHMFRLRDSFEKYFARGEVTFVYDNIEITLNICKVVVLVQGYSAIYNNFKELQQIESAYIVDIGGYTTDIIGLERGNIVHSVCLSEDAGMIHLYNDIKNEMNIRFDGVPKEQQIERLLSDPNYHLDPGMKEVATDLARGYTNELLRRINEKGINLRLSTAIFIGGGAVRLAPFIRESPLVRNPIMITDIRANACGYEYYAKKMIQGRI